ncbi:MAG: histidine--tRNA ligase [Myxococcota bacterium]|nr:histidine--tRNA ligase [Myxococcota bacterium]
MSAIIPPRLMSGMQEYMPEEQAYFNGLKDIIRGSFEKFGFFPIETPTLELTEIILAKGGGETDKQVYQFEKGKNNISLPFDLTVPLARYVSQYKNELQIPFRRYQIQKVWRAERAQKGRFREFYQCDVDIVGAPELAADAEIIAAMFHTLKALEIPPFTFRINNRKIYDGILVGLGHENQLAEVLRTIDKLEKIGPDEVTRLLKEEGLSDEAVQKLTTFSSTRGPAADVISQLDTLDYGQAFTSGLNEIKDLVELLPKFGVDATSVHLDMSITRGLDYYTGMVCETVCAEFEDLGSICSGGRYDNLVENFSKEAHTGVGMSIGLSRLFTRLKVRVDSTRNPVVKLMILPTHENYVSRAVEVSTLFRQKGINTEILYGIRKLQKQLKQANARKVPHCLILGDDEVKNDFFTLKDMVTGDQIRVEAAAIQTFIQKTWF